MQRQDSTARELLMHAHLIAFLSAKVLAPVVERCGDITVSQMRILFMLGKHPQVPQAFIAEALGLTPAAISRQIQNLQKLELLESAPDADNKRQHRLSLTVRGRKVARNAILAVDAFFDDLLAGIPAAERGRTLKSLRRIVELLQRCAEPQLPITLRKRYTDARALCSKK